MADLVRNVKGIEEQVQSVVSGMREIANARSISRSFSFRRIARAVFNACTPVSESVAYSQEYALLPADRRSIRKYIRE